MEKIENIVEFFNFLNKKADSLATDAAYSGEFGDNGAAQLRDEIKIFKCGMEGIIPSVWTPFYKEFNKTHDHEYAEYCRLGAKFQNEVD